MTRPDALIRQLRRSSVVASVGDGLAAVALPLLAARATDGDPLAIAAVMAAQHLPWVLVHLIGRVPSLDRRTVVGLTDTARAIAIGLLGVLTLTGDETILAIQLVAFVVGVGEAWTDRVELETGDPGSLSAWGMAALGLVGFPLGGFLYESTPGPATPLLVDVLLFTVASTLTLGIRGAVHPSPEPDQAAPSRAAVNPAQPAPGARRPDPAAIPLLASAAVRSAAASGLLGVLVLFATRDLGLGAPAFGLLLAGMAAATTVGGLAAPLVGEVAGVRVGLMLALVGGGGAVAVASLAADPDRPWISVVALGTMAASSMVASVLGRARLQLVCGRDAERTLDLLHLATWGAIPVGALLVGFVARHQDLADVLLGLAATWVVAALVIALGEREAAAAPIMQRPGKEIV